jgi:hypothetical protein
VRCSGPHGVRPASDLIITRAVATCEHDSVWLEHGKGIAEAIDGLERKDRAERVPARAHKSLRRGLLAHPDPLVSVAIIR